MDSKLTGEDDSSDPSRKRGILTHQTAAKRFSREVTHKSTQLGQEMHDIPMGESGNSVGERFFSEEKWTTNSLRTIDKLDNNDLRRRIRRRLESVLSSNRMKLQGFGVNKTKTSR